MSDHDDTLAPVGQQSDADEQAGADERRFAVSSERTPRLSISNLSGKIRVRGDDAAHEITVRALKDGGEPVPLALVADVDVRLDGEVVVKVRPFGDMQRQIRRITKSFEFNKADLFNNLGDVIDQLAAMKTVARNIHSVVLEATVPRRCDLAASTTSGAIQVEGIEGDLQAQSASGEVTCARLGGKLVAKTASGEIQVTQIDGSVYVQTASGEVSTSGIHGNLMVQTASGDVQGRDLAGQLGFKSVSGDLVLRESRLTGFYCNTASGDCAIEATLEPGEYEVRSVSGDLSLRTQPDLSAMLTGRTVSGSFRCDLPYRHADHAPLDDDDDEGEARGGSDFEDVPEISLPGIKIGKAGIDVGGFLRIDDETVELPGFRLDRRQDRRDGERHQQRRRGRNRWQYLIGNPAQATEGKTRLRIRTVSGDLSIRPGRTPVAGERPSAASPAWRPRTTATATNAPAREQRGWPDAELWPEEHLQPPTPPVPPVPPTPPAIPALPATPEPPAPPSPPSSPVLATEQDLGDEPATAPASPPSAAPDLPTEAQPEEEAAPAAAAAAPEQTEVRRERTRLDILEALERREITADEALLLLRQLDR